MGRPRRPRLRCFIDLLVLHSNETERRLPAGQNRLKFSPGWRYADRRVTYRRLAIPPRLADSRFRAIRALLCSDHRAAASRFDRRATDHFFPTQLDPREVKKYSRARDRAQRINGYIIPFKMIAIN